MEYTSIKRSFIALLIMTAVLPAVADDRSLQEMQAIAAEKLYTQMNVKGRRAPASQTNAVLCVSEERAYSVFAPTDGEGFVIVAKSDKVEPIWGYSTEPFPATDMPDGLCWFLKEMSTEIADAEKAEAPRGQLLTTATYTPVSNFVKTKWDQGYPYSKSTPNSYPSGCVATAMAQCMNYCQWPNSASFEATYYVTKTSGEEETTEELTATVNSTYTWPYADTYKSSGKVSDNIDILLRDCGYASHMDYSVYGSGTMNIDAGMALIQVFQYPEESIKYLDYSSCESHDAWAQIIYDELAAKCPIIYGGSDEDQGGHAFVFSGVDKDGLVYVNWGWSGSGNGYYAITSLKPRSTGYNFNNYHSMTYGIRKTPLPTDHIETRILGYSGRPYTFRWGTGKDSAEVEHPTLYVDIPYGFINYNATDFKGVLGLFARDMTDGSTWVIAPELQDKTELPPCAGYFGESEEWKTYYYYYFIDGEQGLKPGHTYRMSFGGYDPRDGVWRSILCQDGGVAYDVTYTGDIATSTVNPTRQPVPTPDAIAAPTANTLANDGLTRVYDLQGRLLYTAPTASFNLWEVPARGILVIKEGDKARKVIK